MERRRGAGKESKEQEEDGGSHDPDYDISACGQSQSPTIFSIGSA
jgi:hypothetical protein